VKVRFLVDGQLPPSLAERLGEAGHLAEHIFDLGFGASPDHIIWQHACENSCILVTKDQDFVSLAIRGGGACVLWIRLGNTSNRALWASLLPVLPEIITAFDNGERIVEIR